MAYGLLPSHVVSCHDAKQMYINGHFCYADKFAILTNGLGIVRHIPFIDDSAFKASHPDIVIERKSVSLDEDKALFGDIEFRKAFISLRIKLFMEKTDYTVNENGILCCSHDPTLPMKWEDSKSHLESKIPTKSV